MSIGRTLYWLLTGALLGFGLLAILSIGLPFILLGLILMIFGTFRIGITEIWAALIGFGGVPGSILLWDVTSAPWRCQSSGGGASLPNVNYYTCVDTFVGELTTYHVLAFSFGIIALLGIAWPLVYRLWRQVHHPAV